MNTVHIPRDVIDACETRIGVKGIRQVLQKRRTVRIGKGTRMRNEHRGPPTEGIVYHNYNRQRGRATYELSCCVYKALYRGVLMPV